MFRILSKRREMCIGRHREHGTVCCYVFYIFDFTLYFFTACAILFSTYWKKKNAELRANTWHCFALYVAFENCMYNITAKFIPVLGVSVVKFSVMFGELADFPVGCTAMRALNIINIQRN
jgi:hypothetical protein